MVIPIQEVGARESKSQNGVGIGIGKDSDVMYTLQSGQIHGVAHEVKIYHENIDGKVYESPECPALRDFQKDAPMVTHALPSEGADASEDGTGPVPGPRCEKCGAFCKWDDVSFWCDRCEMLWPLNLDDNEYLPDWEHGWKPDKPTIDAEVANCFNGYTGGPDDNDAQANHLIAFSSKDHGADAGEIAPTLRSQNFKDSHMNGGGQVAIAFKPQNFGDKGGGYVEAETMNALDSQHGSKQQQIALGQFGVRRLTPRECERLQGFPDDWTLYDANGKEISDSARYRMLGNAVAVPVARWIGQRIVEIAKKPR